MLTKALKKLELALEEVEAVNKKEVEKGNINFGSDGLYLYTNLVTNMRGSVKMLTTANDILNKLCKGCRQEMMITPAEKRTGYCYKCRPVTIGDLMEQRHGVSRTKRCDR